MDISHRDITHGIAANRGQFVHFLLQVFFVGALVGMTRTVLPVLSESDFGLAAGAFTLLASFVVIFGVIKAALNLLAGRLSDRYGRKRVLVAGWLFAIPVPFLLLIADSWGWVLLATVFLGINQGLAWSMALNSKLDLTHAHQRGLVNGANEFAGYGGVAVAGYLAAIAAEQLGAREGLFWFGLVVTLLALALAVWMVRDTLPWAHAQQQASDNGKTPPTRNGLAFFLHATWGNRSLLAINQAGLVEKFTDTIIWLFVPILLVARGADLVTAGFLVGIYGVVWGAGQLITGPASDRLGRRGLIVGGMWLCGAGIVAIVMSHQIWIWAAALTVTGIGMAMLYPTLGAAVADHCEPVERAGVLGVYRFWRDFGYAVGALALGLAATLSGNIEAGFWLVGVAMTLSGLWVAMRLAP
ncbi:MULTISPECIES: MFS transporter [unclassified Guyparkeria]|uniref:MFS transporter n=1 Tax=unclassified Guyparkeria TaxID=2626246 RepID=UPI0007333C5E|nr:MULTISPECIES: MFS transporter [unclassified Guyparkeria]KTG16643.1 MFS transporter [Guyparkeria sp. XI15]OAE85677.1 MFS transporter [Guyparkeria sp. WRN-7]